MIDYIYHNDYIPCDWLHWLYWLYWLHITPWPAWLRHSALTAAFRIACTCPNVVIVIYFCQTPTPETIKSPKGRFNLAQIRKKRNYWWMTTKEGMLLMTWQLYLSGFDWNWRLWQKCGKTDDRGRMLKPGPLLQSQCTQQGLPQSVLAAAKMSSITKSIIHVHEILLTWMTISCQGVIHRLFLNVVFD